MISTNQFKNGAAIEMDGDVFIIIEYQHVKPGKGSAFVRTKLKNIRNGSVIDRTFRAGEKVEQPDLEQREMQYLYADINYYFMDTQTYEQVEVPAELVGDDRKFLKENDIVKISLIDKKPATIELPIFVEFKVTETDPGLKGNTASGGTKPAKIETEAIVQVPLFVQPGDKIKIDTRTGEYVTRV